MGKLKHILKSSLLLCKRYFRALNISLIRGANVPVVESKEERVCINCGTKFVGNYCNCCGQECELQQNRYDSVIKRIFVGFFCVDTLFTKTAMHLLYRPGYLIREFIKGRRVRCFPPFEMLFILAALYTMITFVFDASTRTKTYEDSKIVSFKVGAPDSTRAKGISITQGLLTEKDTSIVQDVQTDSVREESDMYNLEMLLKLKTAIKSYLKPYPKIYNIVELVYSWFTENEAFSIVIGLPVWALVMLLAFRKRIRMLGCGFADCIFIQAYTGCQLLIVKMLWQSFVIGFGLKITHITPIWFIMLLYIYDFKQLYCIGWWNSIWRTVLMYIYHIVIVILMLILFLSVLAII